MPSAKFNKDNAQPPGAESIEVETMNSGRLGDSNADYRCHVTGNMPPSALGGDNRQDLGLHAVRGNLPPSQVATHQYGWPGDDQYKGVTHNPEPEEVKRWFRGGSDASGMKSGPRN